MTVWGVSNSILAEWENTYSSAVEFYDNGNYKESIENFALIGDYKDSKERIGLCIERICNKAEERMTDHDYQGALSLLDGIPDGMSDRKEELKRQISDTIKSEQYEEAIQLYNDQKYKEAQERFISLGDYENAEEYLFNIGNILFDQAKVYQSNGDLSSFVITLEHIDEEREWSDYQKSIDLKNSIKKSYEDTVRTQAESTLNSEGYEAFTAYVNSAVNELFTGNDREALIYEYDNYRPVWLKDISPVESKTWGEKDVHDTVDTFGNFYSDAMILMTAYKDEYYYDYLLNGKYNHVSAVLAYDADCYRDHDYSVHYGQGAGHVKIYADDKVVYTSPMMTASSTPEPIDIDLGNDVHMLKIVWQADNDWQAYMILGEAKLSLVN